MLVSTCYLAVTVYLRLSSYFLFCSKLINLLSFKSLKFGMFENGCQ